MNISEYLAYFDLSFSSQSTAVALIDSNLRIIRFNNSASKLYGYQDDEVIGKSLLDLPNLDKEKTAETFTEIFNSQSCHYEFKQRSKQGSFFYVSINSALITIDEARDKLGYKPLNTEFSSETITVYKAKVNDKFGINGFGNSKDTSDKSKEVS